MIGANGLSRVDSVAAPSMCRAQSRPMMRNSLQTASVIHSESYRHATCETLAAESEALRSGAAAESEVHRQQAGQCPAGSQKTQRLASTQWRRHIIRWPTDTQASRPGELVRGSRLRLLRAKSTSRCQPSSKRKLEGCRHDLLLHEPVARACDAATLIHELSHTR